MATQHLLKSTREDLPTVMIERTLRSGQSVHYDGNVVILGDVNPGAQITATGDVVVMGVLRGTVHAGASGDEAASVIAFRLRPTQLRIAGFIGRSPDEDASSPQQPEIAKVRDGIVTIEVFPVGGERQGKN